MSNNNNKMGMLDLTTIENCHLYIDILFKKNQKLMKENEILKDDAAVAAAWAAAASDAYMAGV